LKLTAVELSVGEQAHKVCAVPRRDMVALQVQRNISECEGVAVDVEGLYRGGAVCAVLLGGRELAKEVLGEV
jgi:hypothetical protein